MVFDEQFIMSWCRVQSGGLVERQAHALPQVRDRAKGGEESQRGGGRLPGCRQEHEPFILHVRQFDRYPKPYLSEMCRQASRGRTSGQIYCPIKCAVLYLPKFPSLGTTLITWTERNFQSAWLDAKRRGRCFSSVQPVLISSSVRRWSRIFFCV